MIPPGTHPVRVVVVGAASLGDRLAESGGTTDRSFEVERAAPGAITGEAPTDVEPDCLVIDGGAGVDPGEIAGSRAGEGAPPPVVALVDGSDGDAFADALSAGVADALPRAVAEARPDLLADRVVAAVDGAGGPAEIRSLYDGLAAMVSLHDPETGELLDGNRALCELLGYDREALRSVGIGGLTADVPGYDRERATGVVATAGEASDPVELEWPFETADGAVRWVESRADTATVAGRPVVVWSSRDVTERRRREHAYERVFDDVNDVISIHDPWAGEMVDVNETMTELTGYGREAILEMGVGGVSAGEEGLTAEEAAETHRRVAATGEPETVEWTVETADGERRRLSSNLAPATIGGEDRVLALSRDVTDRREYERRLRRERDRRSMLFENNPDPIMEVEFEDGGLTITAVNGPFEATFGFDAGTIRGRSVAGALVPDSEREQYERLLERTSSGETIESEVRRRTDSGIREFRLRAIPFDVGSGSRRAYVWFTDVTERNRRQRELEEERERYSTLVEQSTDGVAVVADGEYVFVNDRFIEITGYERDRLLDRPFEEVFAPEYRELVRERHGRRVAGESPPTRYDAEIETAGGDRLTLELAVSRITHEGEPAVLANFRDVTARRRRERAVQALQDATERMQEAETADAVAEHAIDATREALGLPHAVCWWHDAERERLEPVAASEPVRDAGLVSPLGADRYEYEVFEDGTATSYVPSEANEENPLETGVLLPLGAHGLIAAGRHEPTDYDDVVLDVARTLAEHTTTALDRVERSEAVRESERRFRLIADRIEEVISLRTGDCSETLYINPAYEEVWGRPIEELRSDPQAFLEGIDPRDREAFEADWEAMLADIERGEADDSYEYEYRIRRPDGEVRWLHGITYPIELETGERRVVGITEDVTERTRREREYEQIFNGVQDGIVVMDPESLEILDVNEAYLDIVGYDDPERVREQGVAGMSASDEGYTVEEGQRIHERVAETGEPETVEWRAETKDGERRWLEVKVAPAVIGGDDVNVAIHRDVTERRRREREYEQIFNGVNDIINVYDPGTAELLEVNDTMCALTGYDRETILEEGLAFVSASEEGFTGERAGEVIEEVMASGEPKELEWGIETADGERVWLDVKATPAVINGEDRLLTISRDVTERRRTERRLRAILDRIDEAIFFSRADELATGSPAPDFVSSGYEAIWGQSLDRVHETYEDGFFGTLHPDDEADYRAFVDGVLHDIDAGEEEGRYSLEYRIERPDGERRWVHSDYYPVRWSGQRPRIVIVSRDVTARKARERRIASFEEATDDLATADTREEAARMAVDGAAETLGLPAVGAFLYDDADGVLRPEVLTGPLSEHVRTDAIAPADGPLWEAFATGTTVAPDGGTRPTTDGDGDGDAGIEDLDAWRGIALGNHGLLLVGSPEGKLSSETIQAAHVLAATLEAALNHLQGRERVAAREDRLRTQTERADRLDRIARLTQQVESVITDASDPGEVERAVCERLAGSGPYDLAWVGGVDVGTDRVAARAVVGGDGSYVDRLELSTTDDAADAHPAVRAWRTDELQVADSLVGDGPAGAWRRHALTEGYQSLCAVPLTYDGITHGVLTVAAGSPHAFGDRERDVLEQLGTSIGYALAAIERRRALESDETVELEFAGDGVDLPFARAAREAGCRVRHERTVAREEGVSVSLGFEGEIPDDVADVASRTLPGETTVVTDEPGTALIETRTDDWFGSPLAEYGAVLREATATPEETTVTVELSAQADVRSFVDRLEKIAPSLSLVAKRQHRHRDRTPAELGDRIQEELTDRQLEALRTALSAGYFEWPRDNDGGEVADRLGITQPTLNKHLRLAERKTFELLFGDAGSDE